MNKGEKEYDDHLPKMCLSFANLIEEKGKYNGCNWEMVELEVVQTCTFVPKETPYVEGGQACLRVVFLPVYSFGAAHWPALSGGNKAALSEEAPVVDTQKTRSPLLTPGGPSLRSGGEQSEASAGASSAPGHWALQPKEPGSFPRKRQRKCLLQRGPGSHRAQRGQTSCSPKGLEVKDLSPTRI